MTDVERDLDSPETPEASQADEPQFSMEESTKKQGQYKGVVVLGGALALCVVAYIFSDVFSSEKEKQPSSNTTTEAVIKSSSVQRNEDDSFNVGFDPMDAVSFSSTQNSSKPTATEEQEVNAAPAEINIALMQELKALRGTIQRIENKVSGLESAITSVGASSDTGLESISANLLNVNNTLKAIGRDGRNRDGVLSEITSGIKGFQVDIREQRQSFDINILHIESWGGRKRVVAYDRGAPDSIYKLYEGDPRGFWTLESINGKNVTFLHEDGIVHEEIIK